MTGSARELRLLRCVRYRPRSGAVGCEPAKGTGISYLYENPFRFGCADHIRDQPDGFHG